MEGVGSAQQVREHSLNTKPWHRQQVTVVHRRPQWFL